LFAGDLYNDGMVIDSSRPIINKVHIDSPHMGRQSGQTFVRDLLRRSRQGVPDHHIWWQLISSSGILYTTVPITDSKTHVGRSYRVATKLNDSQIYMSKNELSLLKVPEVDSEW